ncbi:MAG TPA: hypothetical protein PLQ00_06475, partial [Thermoguttaceae bacterium]|nr:hypothetical protein [Thermoguttaceae bacterium]
QYRAKIHLDVLASEKSLWERYRIECIPEGARVERVVIVFSHARPEPVRWTVGGDSERQWTARRLTEKELSAALGPPGGEAWEITLRPSRSGAFEILGERSSALAAETPISLVGLPQAAAQEAVVRLRTVGPEGPQIFSQRIQPIPAVSEDFIPGWTAQLAAFRYDPKQELTGIMPPALRVRLRQESALDRETWVWRAHLESRFQPDGQADHRVVYWLANFHRTQLTVRIPSDPDSTQIQGVWLNGEPARRPIVSSGPDASGVSVLVDLAPGRTFSVLVIGFRTQGPPLRRSRGIRPAFPQLDVPVSSRFWTVWLPPGFEALYPAKDAVAGRAAEISVRERLFGIWARPEHRQPFDPLDSNHWKDLNAADPQVQRCQEQVETFFQTSGTLLAQSPKKPAPTESSSPTVSAGRRWTWGELLQHEAFNRAGKILIDRQGVWEAGIDPASPVVISSPPAQGAEQRAGREALWQAGLALVVHPGLILITSWERAAQRPAFSQPTGDPLVWYLPGGELVRQMEHAANLRMDPALLSPGMWQESAAPSPAGALRPLEGVPQSSMLGWSAYRLEVPEESLADGQFQMGLLDRDQRQAWYWSAFLAAVGVGLLLVRRSPGVALGAAGLLGAGALLATEPLAPVGGGAFCGMVLALAGWAVCGTSRSPSVQTLPADVSTGASPAPSGGLGIKTGMLLLAFGLLGRSQIFGAEEAAIGSLSSGSAPLYRVFIPIDEKEQPTGDPYQVPEPFYQYLRRRAPSAVPSASRQRLRQAVYRGQLSWNPAVSRWEIPRLSVVWQWDMVGKASQVRLAISRENFVPIPGTWLVEGQPIDPQWNEEEKRFLLPTPAGVSPVRIEGQVRPVLLNQGGFQGIDLPIPPALDARLELLLPPEGPEIRVPGAFGMVKRLADPPPRLIAELGPTEQLSVRWPFGSPSSAPAALPEVEQLLWLRVQPGAVLLDARFRVQFPATSAGGSRFRVMGEGRWRLLSWEVEGGGNMEMTPSPGGPIFEFSLPALGPDRVGRASARFLLTDAAGLGALRLAKLEPLDARVQKRWLAVSVDSSLEYPEPSPNRPQAVAVEEFLNLWGPAASPPRFVDNLSASTAGWSLVCRPRIPNTSAEQTLSLGYGEKTVRVFYEARLTTTSGFSFQHRLQTPPDLEVESITIQQDNTSLPVRWAQTADGKLTVFSYAPLSGRYE